MRSRQKTQDKAPYIDVGQRTDLSQRPGLTLVQEGSWGPHSAAKYLRATNTGNR